MCGGCLTAAVKPGPLPCHRPYAQSTALKSKGLTLNPTLPKFRARLAGFRFYVPLNIVNRLRRTVWERTHSSLCVLLGCTSSLARCHIGVSGCIVVRNPMESVLCARSRVHFACFLLCCNSSLARASPWGLAFRAPFACMGCLLLSGTTHWGGSPFAHMGRLLAGAQ